MYIRHIKLFLALFLAQLFTYTVKAQVTAPAQKPAASFSIFFEKVYLHTDRDYYTQGEDLWFKAYLINAQNNLAINYSNNLYVDLISAQAKVAGSEIINLNNGFGRGDFKLSDSIPAGIYHLRAYTNWMRNFGDNFIFEKEITVLNTQGNSAEASATANLSSAATGAALQSGSGDMIRFFPEGGSLVEDVASLVAFKAEDPAGNGIIVKGNLISSSGDTLTKFESTAQGMGNFVFIPEAKKTYTVKGTYSNNEVFNLPLPAALQKGFVLHVSDADSAHLRVTISTNQATMNDYPNKEVTLTARHTGQRIVNGPVKFVFLQISAMLSKNQFPAGVSSITIYDKQMRPQCERLVYIDNPAFTRTVTLKTDKPTYQPKEKVTVDINNADLSSKANLSLAVVDAGLIPVDDGNIVSYLMLQSELRGNIEHPGMYFDTTNANRFKQLDLLLMTQGWRDFLWRRLADTTRKISYAPENGFPLSGRLREKFADKPMPKMNVLLTVHGEKLSAQYASKTDSLGRFYFNNIRFNGLQPITLASFDQNEKRVGWILIDTVTSPPVPAKKFTGVKADKEQETIFVNYEKEIQKTFKLTDTIHLKGITVRSSKNLHLFDEVVTEFGYPDENFTITKKDYEYKTVADYLLHASNQARSDVVNNNIVFFADNKTYLPRLFVNNREMPFTDDSAPEIANEYYNIYFNVSMEKVEKIRIRRMIAPPKHIAATPTESTTNAFGVAVSAGSRVTALDNVFIVYLTLKPGALDKNNFNQVDTEIDGYYQARTFYKPVYTGPKKTELPDVRATIHWEPNITTNAQGQAVVSFYNAEPKTNVRLVLQGITDKGIPVVATAGYTVK